MCGGDIGKILSNPIVDTVLSVAAPYAGAEFLGPLLGGGALGGALGGAIGGGGASALEGGNITSDLINAGVGGVGGGIIGAGGIGNALTSAGNGIGSAFGDATLGSDIGTSLSNFSPTSGLSSLLGGTAAPTGDLSAVGTGITSAAPADASLSSAAATPSLGAPGAPIAGAATGGGGLGGAVSGSGGGINLSGAGGDLGGLPSGPNGIGSQGLLNTGSLDNFNSGAAINAGNTTAFPAQNGLLNNVLGTSNAASPAIATGGDGSFASGLSPEGSGAFGTGTPSLASGGNNMGLLSALSPSASGTPSAGSNVLNGLLKGGLGYLFNSPNTAGANAINSATQQAQANYQPYLAAGAGAEGTLANLYGTNGAAAQTAAQQNFQNTPGYQFALGQGLNAVNANAAQMGSPLSGNNEQAVNNYAQGTANQTYNNYVNQLSNLAGGGINAAGGSANAGLTGASAIAAADQNKANAANSAIGTGLSALFPSGVTLQQLLGSGGGGSGGGGLLSMLGLGS